MNFDLKLGKAASVLFLALAMAGCGGGGGTTATEPPTPVPDPAIAERAAITTAIGAAETAVAAVNNDSTDAEVMTADDAIMAARGAITAATNVPAEERAANTGTVDALASRLTAAKTARTTAMNEADKAKEMAMMATAMKLHGGISMPGGTGDSTRTAVYGTGDNANDIAVTIGTATAVNLSEDKMAMVADNHDWMGKRYTRTTPATDGMYEAVVYSNVGDPTQGAKFNSGAGAGNVGFATTDGVLTLADATNLAARIASPSFDHSAGTKTFKLPDPNPQGETMITIAGSYYGVAGTYSCNPGTDADGCAVTRAGDGYTLDVNTDAWTFKATNPDDRVTEMPDTIYASYGWWIHKSADDTAYTASAFASNMGTVPPAANIDALMGKATYMGGAAGKYALHSTTGGTNDAGHFTADATLEANFNDDTITGTIDNFMGADGMSRNWSVELMNSSVSATGRIVGDPADSTDTDPQMTKWTIDGTAAAAAGEWQGTLYDNGDDDVPKVGTGTFYSMYGRDGKMVGAFGVNKQ